MSEPVVYKPTFEGFATEHELGLVFHKTPTIEELIDRIAAKLGDIERGPWHVADALALGFAEIGNAIFTEVAKVTLYTAPYLREIYNVGIRIPHEKRVYGLYFSIAKPAVKK